jgi:hypothetical protein
MAMPKYGHAAVVGHSIDPGKWIDKKVAPGRVKVAKSVIAEYDPSKWLLSHATIVASVDVDQKDPNDPKSNYLIKPEYSIFVNNNGDSWERNLLKNCYHTFIGADNYVEHIQIKELTKGKIIDAAIREVPFTKDSEGNDLTTLYVDILVATSLKHRDLVDKIKTGEYNSMSMGCLIEYSQCSKCGNIAKDETQACKHILYFKKNFFYDESGNKRIIAELCGRAEYPDSCKFIEGSWVKKPAFEGALLRNIVNPTDDLSEKLQVAVAVPSSIPSVGDFAKAASATAGHLVRQIQAQEGEEEAPAEPPKDDAGFPEAPEGEGTPLDVDKPEGEETPDAGGGLGNVPAEGPGAEPAAPVPEGDPSVKEVKDLLKRHVLQEIRDELIQKSYNIEPRNTETSPAMENAMNESLVKQAAFKKVIASAKKLGNDRLTNGLLILTNLKNWKSLKRYGYNREDVIGLMHYIDKEASQDPLDSDLVKALASTKESSNLKEFFTDIIVETGKELTPKQARKLAGWRKILRKI